MTGGLIFVVLIVLFVVVILLARSGRYGCMASIGALGLFFGILAVSPIAPWKSTSYATLLPFAVPHEHTKPYQEALANYMLAPRGFDESYATLDRSRTGLPLPVKQYLESSQALLEALDRVVLVDPNEARELLERHPVQIRDMIHEGANPTRLDAAARLLRCRCWAQILDRDPKAALKDGFRLMRLGQDTLHAAHPSHPQLAWKQGLGFICLGSRSIIDVATFGPPLRDDLRQYIRFHLRASASFLPDYGTIHRRASDRNYERLSQGLYFPPESINFKHPKTNWERVKKLAETKDVHPIQVLLGLYANRQSAANELRNVYLDWAPVFDSTSFRDGRQRAEEALRKEKELKFDATRLNLVDFSGLHESLFRMRAWNMALEAVLLIDEYRAANGGRVPANLNSLRSKDPAATTPVDPFTEAAFVYRPGRGGYLLYSPGPDRKDDGGSAERDIVFVAVAPSR